jgi:BlaI family transcriptional regulator, penicillinase repressor
MMRFRFNPAATGLEMILGELERPIMDVIWSKETVTVAEVVEGLNTGRAYNTIKTIMDRLEKKGLLHRVRQSKPVIYEAAINAADLQQQASRSMIEGLVKQFGNTAITEFVAVMKENPALLRELRALLKTLPDDPPIETNI